MSEDRPVTLADTFGIRGVWISDDLPPVGQDRLGQDRFPCVTFPVFPPVRSVDGEVFARITADLDSFRAEMERTARHIARAFGVPWRMIRPWDEHHPRPLTIDGHAYRRRRRARARRRR